MTGTAVDLIWIAPALALLGFVLNGTLAFVRPNAKALVSIIGAGVLLAAFAVAIVVFRAFTGLHAEEPVVLRYWSWIPVGTLQVDFALQVDQLSLILLFVVTGVGSLIHLFSIGYMKEDPGYARYFAYLNLFVFFMLVLVLGANFPIMFVGWEGVGLCSYLLIGFWFTEKTNADAGRKAFIMNRIGDFGFMVAMFMIFWSTGSLDFETVFRHAPTASSRRVGRYRHHAVFLGCTGKSAQIPLYTWLPDAMAGPTPCPIDLAATMAGRVPGRALQCPVCDGARVQCRRRGDRRAHRAVRRDDRAQAVGHQARARLLHHFAARLHVSGSRHGSDRCRHLPSDHPRLLQGAAVPRLGQRDLRDASRVSRDALA
jgi:NADH-quinone oxidoreductase subunit L